MLLADVPSAASDRQAELDGGGIESELEPLVNKQERMLLLAQG